MEGEREVAPEVARGGIYTVDGEDGDCSSVRARKAALWYYLQANSQSEKNSHRFRGDNVGLCHGPGPLRTAQFREPESGRCLRVFQPGYVLHLLSAMDNLDCVQTRKDLFSYRLQSDFTSKRYVSNVIIFNISYTSIIVYKDIFNCINLPIYLTLNYKHFSLSLPQK